MRITARHWGPILGVGLLLLVAHDVPPAHAAEDSGPAWLGVYTQELTTELREGLDYSGSGVLINRVVGDSPADHAGLEKGDVIVRVDSRAIDSPEELADAIRSAGVDEDVALQIVRSGNRRTLNVKLEARPGANFEAPVPRRGAVRRDETPAPEDHEFHFEVPEDGLGMLQTMGRGRLGIRVESLNADLGEYFGVKDGRGALVLEVLKDTPAERAGLKAGDVITRVGESTVHDADDLVGAVRSSEGRVSLALIRQGARRTVEAELDKAPRALRLNPDGVMGWRDGQGRNHVRALPGPERGEMKREVEREMEELRKELRELRREIEELQKN